jgi:hypothetical protein
MASDQAWLDRILTEGTTTCLVNPHPAAKSNSRIVPEAGQANRSNWRRAREWLSRSTRATAIASPLEAGSELRRQLNNDRVGVDEVSGVRISPLPASTC